MVKNSDDLTENSHAKNLPKNAKNIENIKNSRAKNSIENADFSEIYDQNLLGGKNVILIHGFREKVGYLSEKNPAMSESNWFPWLKSQLSKRGIFARNPEMPKPWYPDYFSWKTEVEKCEINEKTVLVGHSFGGGFLARWISETSKKVAKIILVAPFLGVGLERNFSAEEVENYEFFKFEIAKNAAQKTFDGITIFKSSDDMSDISASIDILAKKWQNPDFVNNSAQNSENNFTDNFAQISQKVKIITLKNRGHFTAREKWAKFEFPELLEEILR